jgi:CheY-like chemotaxis protein
VTADYHQQKVKKGVILRKMNKGIWIGMARVVPNNKIRNILKGATYAYVNVICYASSADDFTKQATMSLAFLDLNMEKMEDVELFEMLSARAEPAISLLKLVEEIKLDGKLKFSTFHIPKV